MIAAIYASKSTEQNGMVDEARFVTRHDDRAVDRGMLGMNGTVQ